MNAVTVPAEPKVLTVLHGALMVMEAAQAEGLPLPSVVFRLSVGRQELSWIADSLDEVEAWAARLDVEVEHRDAGDTVQHYAEGELFEQRVSVTWIEHPGVAR